MGPIVGNSTVVPHIVERVRVVKTVLVIVSGILRHLSLFMAPDVQEEEVQSMVIFMGVGEKRGLMDKEHWC